MSSAHARSQTFSPLAPWRERALEWTVSAMERGWIPDVLMRAGMRQLCHERLTDLNVVSAVARERAYRDDLKRAPLAVHTDAANRQHYEVPAAFYNEVLGPHRKYSCAYWPAGVTTLAEAERRALDVTMERAELSQGQSILELGCGWGSLTLAMAERFPNARITAVSNSNSQREYIEGQARARGFTNVRVLTQDIAKVTDWAATFGGLFDRVVSVEMFEHLRNYELLLRQISRVLQPAGKLFVHIFTHASHSYLFEAEGEDNWMGRHFFTGGQMPARDLLPSFDADMKLESQWTWGGEHYAKTSDAWLANMDARAQTLSPILAATYGAENAEIWRGRWRMFFLACSELFGFDGGREWYVSHYLFKRAAGANE